MNKELKAAVQALIEEKVISSDTLFEAIENALITACKSHFGRLENITVEVDKDSFEYSCYAEKTVVELDDDVMDDLIEISLNDARKIDKNAQTATWSAWISTASPSAGSRPRTPRTVILQKIREEERSAIYNYYHEKEKDIMTGVVQRSIGNNIMRESGQGGRSLK